jgi:hypothetical protein
MDARRVTRGTLEMIMARNVSLCPSFSQSVIFRAKDEPADIVSTTVHSDSEDSPTDGGIFFILIL